MSEYSLESFYKTHFAMAQHHKWSIADIENMIPFERDIYVRLLEEHLKKEKK